MKNMKKALFAGMTAAMLAAATLPALAENITASAPAQGMQQQARGGRVGMQRGGQPGRQNQKGQQNGNNGNPFRGGQGTNDNRMNPWRNGQMPDAQTPDNGINEDGTGSAAGNQFFGRRGGHRGGRHGLGTQDLVQQGVIDQETAEKIDAYFKQQKREGQIDKLVEDGVIDQETADKIETWLKSRMPEAPAGDEKPEDAPEAPAEGEVPAEKPEGGDPALAALVEQGVITQEQADAIEAARAAQSDPEAETEI